MDYPGLELENFDKAVIWRQYSYLLIKKYINNNVLEVGAGIGSFTKNYEKKIDAYFSKGNVNQIKEKIKEEMQNAIEKDNYLNPEDAKLINKFLMKLQKEIFVEE